MRLSSNLKPIFFQFSSKDVKKNLKHDNRLSQNLRRDRETSARGDVFEGKSFWKTRNFGQIKVERINSVCEAETVRQRTSRTIAFPSREKDFARTEGRKG